MTAFVKIEGGVVVQKQPYFEDGFIEAPDDVVCDFLFDGETFSAPAIIVPEPPPKTRLFKSTFIRRMTPSEATTLEGVLASEEAYLRMLYHSVEYFEMADALVGYLHFVLSMELPGGAERADELLTPEV